MAANIETMFYTREKPWHGLGTRVEEAPTSKEALELAGLNWKVLQKPIYTSSGIPIKGYKANVRETDQNILGIVTDRYKVVQNDEAFKFTDDLLGAGVRYETAGSLQDGKRIWLLAKLPHEYIIGGEQISPYLVFTNTHDGSGAIKVAVTPVRIVCSNTLNLALSTAKRSWSTIHTGDINGKMDDARETLQLAGKYMNCLGKEFNNLQQKKISERKVMEFIEELLPEPDNASFQQKKNVARLREDMKRRYFDAPDLKDLGNTAYRFVNAVSDFATHAKPIRETKDYQSNLFMKVVDGNPLIDKGYQLAIAA